jgi:hypothetical protein
LSPAGVPRRRPFVFACKVYYTESDGPPRSSGDLKRMALAKALHAMCRGDDPAQVKALLDADAGIDVEDDKGWTPLMEACSSG